MEEKYFISGQEFLVKHMKKALKQLKPSYSEKECKEWEELIRKVESYSPTKKEMNDPNP